jgi:hypothetical protein
MGDWGRQAGRALPLPLDVAGDGPKVLRLLELARSYGVGKSTISRLEQPR